MAMCVLEVQRWLATLSDDDNVFVDEGGLTLRSADQPDAYLEIGGDPTEFVPESESPAPVAPDYPGTPKTAVEGHGTETFCPKSGAEIGNRHVPDWQSLSIESDGGEHYVDVSCLYCGRSGCVCRLDLDSEIDW